MSELNVYQQQGYYNRADYLRCMAEDYCVPHKVVQAIADKLGQDDDFDGLVMALEGYKDGGADKYLDEAQGLDPYKRCGYADRSEYLNAMSEKYGIPLLYVERFSALLGAARDFDGLEELLGMVGELM